MSSAPEAIDEMRAVEENRIASCSFVSEEGGYGIAFAGSLIPAPTWPCRALHSSPQDAQFRFGFLFEARQSGQFPVSRECDNLALRQIPPRGEVLEWLNRAAC